jgi:hypothetical protein
MKSRPAVLTLRVNMASSSSNSSSGSSPEPTKLPKLKARSLEDILHEFGPINEVSYTPFEIKQP